jgi:hypothetical protein
MFIKYENELFIYIFYFKIKVIRTNILNYLSIIIIHILLLSIL